MIDPVIAVGGGSAIVTARAASIVLAEGGEVHALCTARGPDGRLRSPKLPAQKLPQFVVPTTPTTAAVKAGSAVLDPATRSRLALFDPKTRAQAVFVHPDLLATAPRRLVTGAGLHSFAMAVEGLLSPSGDAISDALLAHAAAMLASGLPALGDCDSDAARGSLVMAALMVGHATDFTGAGIALPLGHAISARFGIDNGMVNAILVPHVLRFNAQAAPDGVATLVRALQVQVPPHQDAVPQLVATLQDVATRAGAPLRLREIGVDRASLPQLADVAMQDWFVKDNPRPVRDAADLRGVLEAAW